MSQTWLGFQSLTSLPLLLPCRKQAARGARAWAQWLSVSCHESAHPRCVYCSKTLAASGGQVQAGEGEGRWKPEKFVYWENSMS